MRGQEQEQEEDEEEIRGTGYEFRKLFCSLQTRGSVQCRINQLMGLAQDKFNGPLSNKSLPTHSVVLTIVERCYQQASHLNLLPQMYYYSSHSSWCFLTVDNISCVGLLNASFGYSNI